MIDYVAMDKAGKNWLMSDNVFIVLQMLFSMLIGWSMMSMLSGFVHWHMMSQWVLRMDSRCIMMFYMF